MIKSQHYKIAHLSIQNKLNFFCFSKCYGNQEDITEVGMLPEAKQKTNKQQKKTNQTYKKKKKNCVKVKNSS